MQRYNVAKIPAMRCVLASILCLLLLALRLAPDVAADAIDWPTARQHWAFKPLVKPAPPAVKDGEWLRSPIDAFVLADLEAAGVKPAPPANPYALLRRAAFDLTGLPPTPEEIESFIKASGAEETSHQGATALGREGIGPDARQPSAPYPPNPKPYTLLLDRLLASPHYGERYGRHWFDVARYEQGKVKTRGLKNTRGELDYRDYVIRAFNQDKPFNQFIIEQLAGDLLPAPDKVETDAAAKRQYFDQITATAFLSIGPWFDECTDPNRLRLDMVDEMLTTTGKAFLGLNFNCARCHDHKYDPIATRDYYALAGIFRSTRVVDVFNEEWKDGRLRFTRELATPELLRGNEIAKSHFIKVREAYWKSLESKHAELVRNWKKGEEKYRAALATLKRPWSVTIEAEQLAGMDNLRVATVREGEKEIDVIEGQKLDDQWAKYEVEVPADGKYMIAVLASFDFQLGRPATPAAIEVKISGEAGGSIKWQSEDDWDWKQRRWASTPLAHPLKKGVNTIRLEWSDRTTRFPRMDRFMLIAHPDGTDIALLELARKRNLHEGRLAYMYAFPDMLPLVAEVPVFAPPSSEPGELRRRGLGELDGGEILEFPRAIAVADDSAPTDLPIHQRGEHDRPGDANVPRGVMQLFEHALPSPRIEGKQSGRLELARWLTDRKHPLTARVIANRVWQWHFGVGLVDTPNDFGTRGNPPAATRSLSLSISMASARNLSRR